MTTPTHEKSFPEDERLKLPVPFIFRRLHSLLGIFLAFYLFEHLMVNSQMALYFQNNGSTFVRLVNKIHAIPYLKVVEILVLGLPFLIHALWGVHYAFTSKINAFGGGKKKPNLSQYKRNRSFAWQRWTSWILLIGISLHVIQMRFWHYPEMRLEGEQKIYTIHVENDRQLPQVVSNLDAKIVQEGKEVTIDAPSAGAAFFLVVRNTFKSPVMVVLYSVFVISAAYHGFNGLWTAFITWGVTCTRCSQRRMRIITTLLMWVVMIFGLMACWGPYWTYVWS